MDEDKIINYILEEQLRQEGRAEYVVLNFTYEPLIAHFIHLRANGKRFLFGLEYLVSFNKDVKIRVF